jgi:putative transposase
MSIVRQWLRELATARPRFGYERLHILLTRKRISSHRGSVPVTTNGGQYWAMDVVHDQLASGRKFRVLTLIDKWYRQCVALQADFALTGHSVEDTMEAIALERELPYAITVDQGMPERQ